jgi:hypothetical protein
MLKKFIAILLLICLVAPFTGSYLFIHYKRNKIRKEVTALILKDLEKKDIAVLKFSGEEVKSLINWKHDSEFEYNGHMYDVVDQHYEGDSVILTCYKDQKETSLNHEKQKLIAKSLGQDPVQKNLSERIKNFFSTVFQKDVFAWKAFITPYEIVHFASLNQHLAFLSLNPLFPPPKIV